MLITRKSPFTGKTRSLEIPLNSGQIARLQGRRESIQNILPHLTPSEREFIMTGITEEEWCETFQQEPNPDAYANSTKVDGW